MWNGHSKESTIRLRRLGLLIMIMLVITSAAIDSYAESTSREVTLNKPFEIKLKANPSTGYKWEVTYDKGHLRLDKERHKRDRSKPVDQVGVGGVTTFVFVPIKKGETKIDFQYKRPWEEKVDQKRSYRMTIVP